MNKFELQQIIQDQSRLAPKGRLVEREALRRVMALHKSGQIIIITGLRRCGKSTLLQQIRHRNQPSDYYLNFDDDRLVKFTADDFQKLYELFLELFGEQSAFYFDEIQNVPGWERFIRRLHDHGNKIYITGSNASMLSRELGTHLTGRFYQAELYPFSFREYLAFKNVATGEEPSWNSTAAKSALRRQFHAYLADGGIPEFIKTGEPDYLKSLYEGVLYRDILARYRLGLEKPLKELLFFIAGNIAKDISFNSVKPLLGLGSSTTVKEYFHYFQNAYLCFLLNRHDYSVKKQIFSPKKIYFIDPAMARQVGFRASEDQGRMLENMVFLELKRQGLDVYFHRQNFECDFLVREKGRVVQAIQVCLNLDNPKTRTREIAGLADAMTAHHLSSGLILTDDDEAEIKEKTGTKSRRIQVLPVWKWLLQVKL